MISPYAEAGIMRSLLDGQIFITSYVGQGDYRYTVSLVTGVPGGHDFAVLRSEDCDTVLDGLTRLMGFEKGKRK